MAEYLTRDQIQESLESFRLFDNDSDGLISFEELDKTLRSLGINLSNQELNSCMEELDEDNLGLIDFYQLLEIVAYRIRQNDILEEYTEMCRVYDKNGEGRITESDLRQVFQFTISNLTGKEIDELIFDVTRDCDGSGLIDFKDFIFYAIDKYKRY